MPYVTSVERLAMERGRKEGQREELLASIARALEKRFGAQGKKLLPKIQAITDADTLRNLVGAIWTAANLAEVKQALRGLK